MPSSASLLIRLAHDLASMRFACSFQLYRHTVPNAALSSLPDKSVLLPFLMIGDDICNRGLSCSEFGVLLRPPVKKLKMVEWDERSSPPSFDAVVDSEGGTPGDGGPVVSIEDMDNR